MPSKRHKKITDIFRAACELEPEARAAFLDQACGGDSKLRAEVEALLAQDAEHPSFLENGTPNKGQHARRPKKQAQDGVSPDATKAIGHTGAPLSIAIEGYDIVRELQRGGQGVVYQAVQRSTKRKVAIKVLLEGPYASESSKKRFEREIEMVAQLKHPNIIPIFHSGKTSDGHHYYVMDYVRGEPLNHYVRDAKPTLEEALALFGKVCDAVNYAHQKGVIHRDLKPSNVLVDVEGEPRLLDFGLAKMVSGPVQTLVSVTGQVVGTLPYMSPEQTRGNPDEIDIRTDVYALGVMLYELLTGHYPYPVVGEMAEVLKHIADTEPTPPSRQWTKDSGITKRTSRALRAGQCPIDDELQTIVLKTLSKERERRYQSAGELARDLDRYSAGEPIDAKRDSGWYLLRKTFRRHKTAVATISAVVVLMVLLGISSLFAWQWYGESERARRAAVAARTSAQEEQMRAEKEASTAKFRLDIVQAEMAKTLLFLQEWFPRIRRASEWRYLLAEESRNDYPNGLLEDPNSYLIGLFPEWLESDDTVSGSTIPERLLGILETWHHDPGNSRNAPLFDWIRQNDHRFEQLLDKLGRYAFGFQYYFTAPAPDYFDMAPSYQAPRTAGLLLLARAVVRHIDDDPRGALESLRCARRIARSVGDCSSLTHQLFETRLRGRIYTTYNWLLVDAISTGEPTPYPQFIIEDPPYTDWTFLLQQEEIFIRQSIDYLFTYDTANAQPKLELERLEEEFDSLSDEWKRRFENAHIDYDATMSQLSNIVDRWSLQQDATIRDQHQAGPPRELEENPLLAYVVPHYRQLLVHRRLGEMHRDASIILTALCDHKYKHGQWSEDLDSALATFNVQPESRSYYEQNFGFRIVDDLPRLYVAGADFADDGGEKHCAEPSCPSGTDRVYVLSEGERKAELKRAWGPHLRRWGVKLVKEKRYREAEPVIRECLQVLSQDHSLFFHTMSYLGASLAGQQKFDEAERLLLESYQGMRDDPRVGQRYKREVLGRILELYDAWGKPDKTAEWRAKLPPDNEAAEPTP